MVHTHLLPNGILLWKGVFFLSGLGSLWMGSGPGLEFPGSNGRNEEIGSLRNTPVLFVWRVLLCTVLNATLADASILVSNTLAREHNSKYQKLYGRSKAQTNVQKRILQTSLLWEMEARFQERLSSSRT